MEHRLIGKPVPRVDAEEKVTGSAVYGADVSMPGMLHGKILRSDRPHARIVAIDTSRALRLPGVKAVLTSEDVADVTYTVHFIADQQLLARGKVRHIGEPVAVVAAVDVETAEEALELIDVVYEDLPPIFDPVRAMDPDAPLVHEDVAGYKARFKAIKYGNVCSFTQVKQGDVSNGFEVADLVIENTFSTAWQHHAYLEPHACLADVASSGKVTIWTTSQIPARVRSAICQTLQLPMSQVRVIITTVGGGFGGKETLLDPFAALLSRRTGRPVKMVLTRHEELIGGRPHQATLITMKTGVRRDGTLTAVQAKMVYDAGAYADQTPGPTAYGATFLKGPYRVDNILVDAYCVYTNNPPSGAFRGYGSPPQCWATESQMDLVAAELGMDPVELRRINACRDGDLLATGQERRHSSMCRVLDAAVDRAGWSRDVKARKAYRGRGIACMERGFGMFSSGIFIKVNEDGTFALLTGTVDIGTGAKTVLAQIAAEELGIDLAQVSVQMADTDISPYDYGASASRTTYTAGNSVRQAAREVRQQLFELASPRLGVDPGDLELRSGQVQAAGDPGKSVPVAQLAQEAVRMPRGPIQGRGSFGCAPPAMDPATVTGYPLGPVPGLVYGAQVAEVAVDPETGQVEVLRLICAQDVGKAINPAGVKGQIDGGLVQGMGGALLEELLLQDGRVLNANLLDYKVPTSLDAPRVEAIIIEEPEDTGPYGAKGIGEAILVPTAAAIANAIHDATGVRITSLPITPEKLLSALRAKTETGFVPGHETV